MISVKKYVIKVVNVKSVKKDVLNHFIILLSLLYLLLLLIPCV